MAKNKTFTPIKIGPGIMSYPHLIVPQERKPKTGADGKLVQQLPDYNGVMVFTKKQVEAGILEPLKKMAAEARDHFFGANKPRGLKSPFRKNEEAWKEGPDGKLIPEPGYEAGGMWISLKAGQNKPDCRDQKMVPITDPNVLYPGCQIMAVVTAYGYDYEGTNKGVSIGLKALQKVGEGENIGGRVSAEDYFEPVDEQQDNATTGATTGDDWDDDSEEY